MSENASRGSHIIAVHGKVLDKIGFEMAEKANRSADRRLSKTINTLQAMERKDEQRYKKEIISLQASLDRIKTCQWQRKREIMKKQLSQGDLPVEGLTKQLDSHSNVSDEVSHGDSGSQDVQDISKFSSSGSTECKARDIEDDNISCASGISVSSMPTKQSEGIVTIPVASSLTPEAPDKVKHINLTTPRLGNKRCQTAPLLKRGHTDPNIRIPTIDIEKLDEMTVNSDEENAEYTESYVLSDESMVRGSKKKDFHLPDIPHSPFLVMTGSSSSLGRKASGSHRMLPTLSTSTPRYASSRSGSLRPNSASSSCSIRRKPLENELILMSASRKTSDPNKSQMRQYDPISAHAPSQDQSELPCPVVLSKNRNYLDNEEDEDEEEAAVEYLSNFIRRYSKLSVHQDAGRVEKEGYDKNHHQSKKNAVSAALKQKFKENLLRRGWRVVGNDWLPPEKDELLAIFLEEQKEVESKIRLFLKKLKEEMKDEMQI